MEQQKLKGLRLWLWLFGVNFYISAFTFGGGYVVIPMIRKNFVTEKKLFSEDELLDMAAVAQSSPGAIAVNLAVLAGYRVGRFAGAVASCVAAVLPPLLILAAVSFWYAQFRSNLLLSAALKGMEAGVAALIVEMVCSLYAVIVREKSFFHIALAPCAFFCAFFLSISVVKILLCSVLLCLVRLWVHQRRRPQRTSERLE